MGNGEREWHRTVTREIAEARIAARYGDPTLDLAQRPDQLVHELQVHQVELEMQNDELKRTHLELERSRDRYLDLYDSAPIGYFTISFAGRIEDVNLAGAALLGVPRDQVLGRGFGHFVAPVDLPHWEHHLAGVRRGSPGEKWSRELTLQRDDGASFYARLDSVNVGGEHARGSPALRPYGDPHAAAACACLRAVVVDLSEAKRAEALRESESRYRVLMEQASDGIFVADPDGRYVDVNSAGCEMLGYQREELLRMSMSDLSASSAPSPLELAQLRQGVAVRREGELVKKDGTLLPVEISAKQLSDGRLQGIVRDITGRKQAEAELRRMTDALRQSERMESVGRLAAGVAHDLNNYLTPILGFAHMLAQDADPASNQFRDTQEIIRAAECSRDLVKDLLAFGRGQVLDVKVVDLRSVVLGMERLLRRTLRENIAIEVLAPADACGVEADAGQLGQVLMNLAVNAQDAMPEGGKLTVTISVEHFDAPTAKEHPGMKEGRYVVLRVSDTGCGMDEATQQHVFEPFFTTRKTVGTGLGLATVFGIVQQHRGCIWITSAPGQGSLFTLCLPAVSLELAGRPKPTPLPRDSATRSDSQTILVVEDNELTLRLLREILHREGYSVLCAASGEEALTLLDQDSSAVDLLLTDVLLPGINGRVAADRAREKRPALRVVFTSGYCASVLAQEGKLEPGIVLVQKPFTVAEISAAIRDALEQ